MAVNFPDSPTNGQQHTVGNAVYSYNSAKGTWVDVAASSANTAVKIGSWEIKLAAAALRISYSGSDMARITTSGDIIALGNVETEGSP
jgi:hypothetical protein